MKTETVEETRTGRTSKPVRVLLLARAAQDAELILAELRASDLNIEHTLAENREQFFRALQKENFDAVLAYIHLPEWTGLDALKELRAAGKDIPFLLVAGAYGEEAAVECIKQGISDYVLKHHISRLPVALKRVLHEKAQRNENNRAQEALRLSEARNRDLVENSVYGIFRATSDGTFLDSNPALLAILGCGRAEDLMPLNLVRDIYRFPEQFAQHMADCRAHGLVHGAETEWRRRDGGIVTVRLHLRRLSIPEQPDAVEFLAEDVTELRAMERQVRQSQKFEAIGQLAGGIAHDFNNVVGAILGWAELGYEQNRASPQTAERFARIREQAERAAALTRELLAFARRQILQPRAVDLNAVASGLASFLDKVIGKDIEFKVITAPVDPIKADPAQLEQVLMNLCLNARDAMPQGGRLLIETEMVELDDSYCRFYRYVSPGRYAVLSVSDTGVGMDVETRERIFEPFFSTKERGNETGIGLATVYGIVKQHGGYIHVYSEPGHGSLFRIYLPVMEGAVQEGPGNKAAAPALADMRGSETILLAEDHDAIREMARQALVSLGYRVLSACDGVEALLLCENEEPALAILDVIMPKLGGPAAAEKLLARYDRLPILFTSGYTQETESVARAVTGARYLQKPYSPTTLGCMVREILDKAKKNGGSR